MRLLVTGGAGYIGSIVAAHLLDLGHEVTVADNLSRGHRDAVPRGAVFREVDLLDEPALGDLLAEGFDGVLHFAALALVAESMERPEIYWRVNARGTANLLDAMRAAGTGRLVFSSTCATYGEPENVPITEDEPAAPVNPYGASKLAVDQMISFESLAHGLGAISLRYFNVAGADRGLGEHHEPETHLIPRILAAAAGSVATVEIYGTDYPTPDGTAIRDYVHVRDLARAHVLALEGIEAGEHGILNLGSGSGYSVREVVAAAREVTGEAFEEVECPRRAGDPPRLVASNARIRERLGWEPRETLASMIADAWGFVRSHPGGYAR
jgi:UDP-glucose 4-epimerase